MRFFLVTTQKFGLKITQMKSTCKLNSLVVSTGLQSPGPRIDSGSARPPQDSLRYKERERERERERRPCLALVGVLFAFCLLFQCFSAALLRLVCELQARLPRFPTNDNKCVGRPFFPQVRFSQSLHLFGALDCFVSCFCFFVSSLIIICDDNPFGFCVCVCVCVWFLFYFPL
jgi:hypothetical protein